MHVHVFACLVPQLTSLRCSGQRRRANDAGKMADNGTARPARRRHDAGPLHPNGADACHDATI